MLRAFPQMGSEQSQIGIEYGCTRRIISCMQQLGKRREKENSNAKTRAAHEKKERTLKRKNYRFNGGTESPRQEPTRHLQRVEYLQL